MITSASPTIVGSRVYPLYLIQDPTYPCINYERVSTVRDFGIGGYHNRAQVRIRLHCWSQDYSAAKTAANSARSLLEDYSGTVSGVEIGWIRSDGESDHFADAPDVYRSTLDLLVSHKE